MTERIIWDFIQNIYLNKLDVPDLFILSYDNFYIVTFNSNNSEIIQFRIEVNFSLFNSANYDITSTKSVSDIKQKLLPYIRNSKINLINSCT